MQYEVIAGSAFEAPYLIQNLKLVLLLPKHYFSDFEGFVKIFWFLTKILMFYFENLTLILPFKPYHWIIKTYNTFLKKWRFQKLHFENLTTIEIFLVKMYSSTSALEQHKSARESSFNFVDPPLLRSFFITFIFDKISKVLFPKKKKKKKF